MRARRRWGVGAPAGGGFGVNVFVRGDDGTVYRTSLTNGRRAGRRGLTYTRRLDSDRIAELYGDQTDDIA